MWLFWKFLLIYACVQVVLSKNVSDDECKAFKNFENVLCGKVDHELNIEWPIEDGFLNVRIDYMNTLSIVCFGENKDIFQNFPSLDFSHVRKIVTKGCSIDDDLLGRIKFTFNLSDVIDVQIDTTESNYLISSKDLLSIKNVSFLHIRAPAINEMALVELENIRNLKLELADVTRISSRLVGVNVHELQIKTINNMCSDNELDLNLFTRESLENLSMDINCIQKLKLTLPNKLQKLEIINSLVNNFDDSNFADLNTLRHLNLRNNQLESFDFGQLSHMSQLEFVDLSHNKITSISGRLYLNQLQNLDLSYNQLKKFQMSSIYGSSAKDINLLLQNNDINAIIFNDLQISSESNRIDIFLNDFIETCNCQSSQLLLFLNTEVYKDLRDKINLYPKDISCKNHNHKYLRNIEMNQLECAFSEKECPSNCICNLPRKNSVLKIKCTGIAEFPKLPSEMLLKKKHVREIELDLSNNKLTALPQQMPESWYMVSDLNISYNYIRNIEFHQLPTKMLDIRSNCLTILKDDVCTKLKNLQSLYINSFDNFCLEKVKNFTYVEIEDENVKNFTHVEDETVNKNKNHTEAKQEENSSYMTNYVLAGYLIIPIVICALIYVGWRYMILNGILFIDDLPNRANANNILEMQPMNLADN
ncbi:hypothetical protein PVAND_008929 [Polypedilum vanderplanki]|uniref:Uncharacterized protein n=1 Tax=Polypedilum vanderplanki TaxID=319348 RepID=A0A9J6CBI6_POLVA|nr:hypothetical protein PVAND_008929 [Polypedilum vanderplanki]